MSSSRPATVSLSLAKLAEHGGHTGPHRDGWGVGYYDGLDVRLIKDAEAAADSDWVRFIQAHGLQSQIVMAHVRRATMGARSYSNTQPFSRELAGRMHLFAHNGWMPALFEAPELAPLRFAPIGETDSEWAFCALLDRMTQLWDRPGNVPSLGARFELVCSFAQELRQFGPANFLYSDGEVLFAHGHRRTQAPSSRVEPPGLVVLQRQCRAAGTAIATPGLSVAGDDQNVAIVASVSLSDEPWQPLREGEVVAIVHGRIAARHSARLPAPETDRGRAKIEQKARITG